MQDGLRIERIDDIDPELYAVIKDLVVLSRLSRSGAMLKSTAFCMKLYLNDKLILNRSKISRDI